MTAKSLNSCAGVTLKSQLHDRFNTYPTCPACHGARPLTRKGLCETCTRELSDGRLTHYTTKAYEDQVDIQETLPALFKRTANGGTQVWAIRVDPQDDGSAIIVTTHGLIDGAKQEARDHITQGKNAGRKNATTPLQQAIAEATSKWNKQRDRNHYGLTVEESEAKKFIAPMLAQKYTDDAGQLTSYAKKINWDDHEHLHVQPKFDGHRCLAIRGDRGVQLFTRKGVEIETCGHIVEQLSSIMPEGVMIDGELYIHGIPVTTIGGYIAKEQAGTEDLKLVMYDAVNLDAPFINRVDYLEKITSRRGPHLHLARTTPIACVDDLMNFQGQCIEHGYEGAMLRHGRAGYEPGKRSHSLLKVKNFIDGEFTIVGCKEGRGGFAGAAVFECVTEAGNPFDVTAPGSMPEKQAIWQNHQAYIGKRLEIKYQTWTQTDKPVPFQPVAKGVRLE